MVVQFFRKYRIEIAISVFLIASYWMLRLTNILSLPMFTDEAIYTRWAQIAKQDASWRFISLTDGKQPLFIWIDLLMMHVIKDPLLAGRVVSAIGGFFTMIGLFFLGREAFKNRWIGIVSAGLYVMFPFGLVYDRMALYDSLIGTFTVWSLYFEILLIRKIRLDLGLVLGMVIGGAMLNKTNGFFSLYLLPFSVLLFDFRKKKIIERLGRWGIFAIVAAVVANVYYSVLRLSPFYHIIAEKNAVFVYPLRDWIHHPFTFFIGNFNGLWNWFTIYVTWPVILLVAVSFLLFRKFQREKLLLFAWFAVPFLAEALFGKTIYPRYILFMCVSLLPLVSLTVVSLFSAVKNKYLASFIAICFFIPWLIADYFIILDFARAPIPTSDLNQYVNDWPAGAGVNQAVQFFSQKAKNGKVFIGTEGTFGLLPYAFEIYLVNNPNVKIVGYWPIKDTPPKDLLNASKIMPTYVVFYQPCPSCPSNGTAPLTWPITRIASFRRGTSENFLTIYQVKP